MNNLNRTARPKLTLRPGIREQMLAAGLLKPVTPAPPAPPKPQRRPGEPSRFDQTLCWLNQQFNAPLEHPVLPRWPFALGIREALLNDPRLKSDADPVAVISAVAKLARSITYLKGVARPGARRWGIDGVDAGPVSAEDRAYAERVLEERKNGRAAR